MHGYAMLTQTHLPPLGFGQLVCNLRVFLSAVADAPKPRRDHLAIFKYFVKLATDGWDENAGAGSGRSQVIHQTQSAGWTDSSSSSLTLTALYLYTHALFSACCHARSSYGDTAADCRTATTTPRSHYVREDQSGILWHALCTTPDLPCTTFLDSSIRCVYG